MTGVLAQLGARNIRIVEATGSNPVYSIIESIAQFRYCGYAFFIFGNLKIRKDGGDVGVCGDAVAYASKSNEE